MSYTYMLFNFVILKYQLFSKPYIRITAASLKYRFQSGSQHFIKSYSLKNQTHILSVRKELNTAEAG